MVKRVTNDGTDSGREKIIYTITAAGQESLREWLKDSKATNDLKYETILKLYFGGSCDARVSIHTIEQFENEITEDLALLRIYEDSLSKVLDEKDHVHFYLTVLFGIETYEAYLRWSQRAKEILREKIL